MCQRPARIALWGEHQRLSRQGTEVENRADRDGSSLRQRKTKESPASLEGLTGPLRCHTGKVETAVNPRSEALFREHKEPRSRYRFTQVIASQSCRARSS